MSDDDVGRELTRTTSELTRRETDQRPALDLIEQRARARRRRSTMRRSAVAAVFVATLVGVGAIAATSGHDHRDRLTIAQPSTSLAGTEPTSVTSPATKPTKLTTPTNAGIRTVRTVPWISTVIEPGTRASFERTLDASGVSSAPNCTLGDLDVVASIGGASGADYAGIKVRNQSPRPCSVQGSPYVGFLDSAGRSVGAYTPHSLPTDPTIILVPHSWAAVGLTIVGADYCPGPNNVALGGTTAAAIAFGIDAGETRVVHPAANYGWRADGCPVSVTPGSSTGAFEAIPTGPGDQLLYEPLRSGMTLNAPAQMRRGETATYFVTFTNTSLNTFPLVDDCPLYRESLGTTESGTLPLNCNGSAGLLVGPGESIRFAMKLAVPGDQPLGETTLHWQFIEPDEPALTAQVAVVNS